MIGGADSRVPIAVQMSLRSHKEHRRARQSRVQRPGQPRLHRGPPVAPSAKPLGEIDACVALPAVDLIVRSGQISNQMPRTWIGETAYPGQEQVDRVVSV